MRQGKKRTPSGENSVTRYSRGTQVSCLCRPSLQRQLSNRVAALGRSGGEWPSRAIRRVLSEWAAFDMLPAALFALLPGIGAERHS
jgi:hypothetical protein